MPQMKKRQYNSELPATERAQLFHEQFDSRFDPADSLPEFVLAAGDYLARIVGKEDVDAGMAQIVSRVVGVSGRDINATSEWRTAIIENRSNCFSEFKIGEPLHNLAAYARYGIILHDSEDAEELSKHLMGLLKEAEDLEFKTPFSQWGLNPINSITYIIKIARNRWALDNKLPVEPVALAFFGGVSEGRIRNMMSGADSKFEPENGRIPAQQALKWLADRPEFWNSIWREQSLPLYETGKGDHVEKAIFIPVSRDGSTFHPDLRRGQSYTLGKKGEEIQVADFDEALAHLQRMPVPYWRRPNAAGNWGSVSGVRWERFDAGNFKSKPVKTIDDSHQPEDQ
jgi:hypothetical protein